MHVLTPTAAALLACVALISCGSGELDASSLAGVLPGPATAAPTQVSLEGCIVDAQDRPLSQAMQVRASDGRTIATAMSDARGVFRLHVPAREVLRIETMTAGGDGLTIMTGSDAAILGGCLRG
jgi:hypothetical protein